jgi:excisionase family DNA binding protein
MSSHELPRAGRPGRRPAPRAIAPASDVDVLVHLAVALTVHERRQRARGVPLPQSVADIARFLRACVTARQEATSLDESVQSADDAGVRDRLLLTKGEAAASLGVSVRTLERMVAAGRLPVVHVEGACRIRVADITAYVERLDPRPPTQPPVVARPSGGARETTDDAGPDGCGVGDEPLSTGPAPHACVLPVTRAAGNPGTSTAPTTGPVWDADAPGGAAGCHDGGTKDRRDDGRQLPEDDRGDVGGPTR